MNYETRKISTFFRYGLFEASKSPEVASPTEAIKRGNGSSCYNNADFWAVAVGLSLNASTSWCVDNQGSAKVVNSIPSGAINPSTFLCN